MNETANKIQMVIDTLQGLDIKSTFSNMNHLMGAIQMLVQIRDEMKGKDQGPVLELIADDEKIEEVKAEGDRIHE